MSKLLIGVNKSKFKKLSDILKRNDIKKRDVYRNAFGDGTTLTYKIHIQLRKNTYAFLKWEAVEKVLTK